MLPGSLAGSEDRGSPLGWILAHPTPEKRGKSVQAGETKAVAPLSFPSHPGLGEECSSSGLSVGCPH